MGLINNRYIGKRGGSYPLAKKVNQYDLNGDFIKTWPSIKDASRALNIFSPNISACLRGKTETAGLYKWKYAELQSPSK